MAEDMLVQILTRAHTQNEATGHHRGRRRRGLCHDAGMYSDGWTSHCRSEHELFGRVRDPADHRPDKGALPLSIDPRVKVIRNHGEGKTAAFCTLCLRHEIVRTVLFAG
jgi:hypothetical protein